MPVPALELTAIDKSFGHVSALESVSLTVRRGTVHALIGENGAGKTTLMRIAFGMLRPDSGSIRVSGIRKRFASPSDAIGAGIGMVHQHFTLVPAMTVTENIALGGRGVFRPRLVRRSIQQLAEQTGLLIDPDARVEDMPAGAQQRVEILKALSRDTTILILDEPTAVLTPVEARELLFKLRELASRGRTVVLITHKLGDALEFADDLTVLRRGAVAWSGASEDATETTLMSAMLGDDAARTREGAGPASTPPADADVMVLHDVTVRDALGIERLKSASLRVRCGEILGVAAVEGSGQRELLRLLAGRVRATRGQVLLPPVVGFIPEDRQRDALVQEFSLRDNVALLGAGDRRGMMPWTLIHDSTRRLMHDYDVRATDANVRAGTLSGGNQQKFVIGREIDGSHAALVAENPSRGLDVHATAAIHARMRSARDAGMGVVMYSSDLDEVMALADRVVVVYAGKVIEVPKDYDAIGRAMVGLTAG